MSDKNKKRLFIGVSGILVILLSLLIVLHIKSFIQTEKKYVFQKAASIFKESINMDLKNRSKSLTGKIEILNSMEKPTDKSSFKSSTIEIKTPLKQNQSLDEKMADFLQSVLAVKNPINVYHLDTIFQQKLKEENINMVTIICLTDTINKIANSCTRMDIASFSPLFMKPYLISSVGISLQAYIQISNYTLIKRMPISYWGALLGWLLFTLSILYAWFSIRKKIPVLIKEKEQLNQEKIKEGSAFAIREKTLQSELTKIERELETFKLIEKRTVNPDIHIFSPCSTFDINTKTLRYNGENIKLTRQQQQLLVAFCNAPKNTCTLNDIHSQVWKGCKVEENTIQQAISRLNIVLKKIPNLQIVYEFKDSYKLISEKNKRTE